MADINSGQAIRLEAGGTVSLFDDTTEHSIVNRDKGTIVCSDGGYEPLYYSSKGVQQPPLEGDARYSTITGTIKLTSLKAAEFVALAKARDTSTGRMKEYTKVVISWPAYKGSADLHTRTYNNVHFPTPPIIREGTEFDTVEFTMMSRDALGTDTAPSE